MKLSWLRRAVLAAAIGVSFWATWFAIDFWVYHMVAGVFLQHGVIPYGPETYMPWPMWYRYPPVFVFLMAPLAVLPLRTAVFLWAVLKFCALAGLLRALLRRSAVSAGWKPWFLGALIAGPFVAHEIRFGNVQFFVFTLVVTTLSLVRSRPVLAALCLGLGTAVKVWPLFFVPYLAVRRSGRLQA